MPRKGRLLELLVQHLEQFIVPEGVQVTSPEEFYDSTGQKIAEIDVTLRGKFGSAVIFIGIECRDRPAEGQQGAPWIREIHGKKEQLDVDKMLAVSTTGFTDPAVQAAEELGIE